MASPQESVTTVSGRRCTRSRARTAAISTSTSSSVITSTEVTTSTAAASSATVDTSAAIATSAAAKQPSPVQAGPVAPPPAPPPPPPSLSSSSSSSSSSSPSSSPAPVPGPPPPPPPPSSPSAQTSEQTAATSTSEGAAPTTTGTNNSAPTITSSSACSSSFVVPGPSAAAIVPVAAAPKPAVEVEAEPSQAALASSLAVSSLPASSLAVSSLAVTSPTASSVAPTSTAQASSASESLAPEPEAEVQAKAPEPQAQAVESSAQAPSPAPPASSLPPPASSPAPPASSPPPPASSNNVQAAVPVQSATAPTSAEPAPVAPVTTESTNAPLGTPIAALPDEISQSDAITRTALAITSVAQSLKDASPATSLLPGVPTGTVLPEQSSLGDQNAANAAGSGLHPNVKEIVGGAVGGFVGLALLAFLLFFCLRRRKSKQTGWSEKHQEESGFMTKMKAVPGSVGVFFAKMQSEKAGPVANPYKRHVPHASVSSVYSEGHGRSTSDPAMQASGFLKRMSSKKSERNVLRKKNSSVSSQSAFIGIVENPVRRASRTEEFKYPFPSPDPPRNLTLVNPDDMEIAANQGPRTPQPTARDPFASLADEIEDSPGWRTPPVHRHTPSTGSAYAASSIYSTNPFADPMPPPPLPMQLRTPATTYSAFPSQRESHLSGEPGPTRPGTTVFEAERTARQSDPFDLDRPEVLGFKGFMTQMREGLTRQASYRSWRRSSIVPGVPELPTGALNGGNVRR